MQSYSRNIWSGLVPEAKMAFLAWKLLFEKINIGLANPQLLSANGAAISFATFCPWFVFNIKSAGFSV